MSNYQKAHQSSSTQTTAKAVKAEHKSKTSLKPAQILEAPETLRHEEVLAAQQQLGNQVVQRALDKKPRQREMNTDEHGNLNPKISDTIQQMRGGGSPLPESIQKDAGEKLGRGFKDVRIHVDEKADQLSRSINARAFTIGRDIFFKKGVFAPGTSEGRETLIHELTHVVQQAGGRGAGGRLKLGAPGTALEKEAEQMGKKHGAGASKAVAKTQSPAVQKQAEASVSREMGSGVEGLSGLNMDDVKVHHNSPQPAQLNARAYAQGSDLHVGPGQERHLPHEAWHVVQQRQGRVQPSMRMGDEAAQMQSEEEETLQMQPEAVGTVQRVEEEEALQMQPEPASAGVVQRTLAEELDAERVRRLNNDGRKKRNVAIDKLESQHEKSSLNKGTIASAKISAFSAKNKAEALGAKGKAMGIGSEKNLKKLSKLDAGRDKEFKSRIGGQLEEERQDRHTMSRNNLMSTIKNKKSSPEEVKAAQEQLDMLHKRSKTDTVKSFFTPGATTKSYSEQAQETRKKSLKEAARSGDKDAFNKYKEEKAERNKNSTSTKVKGVLGGLASKVGGLIGGAVSDFGKGQVAEYKAHFTGKRDEPESAGAQEPGSSSNANAGVGAMMEKYGELVKENQSLKQKLQEMGAK